MCGGSSDRRPQCLWAAGQSSCAVRQAALWALGAGVRPDVPSSWDTWGFTEEAKGPWG